MHTLKLNEPKNKDRHDIVSQMSEENRLDYGYYLMRTNYKVKIAGEKKIKI